MNMSLTFLHPRALPLGVYRIRPAGRVAEINSSWDEMMMDNLDNLDTFLSRVYIVGGGILYCSGLYQHHSSSSVPSRGLSN